MRDIFSDMQAKVGCRYISDLPRYKKAVWFELCRMPLDVYDLEQLEDFSRYVFSMNYAVVKEAMRRPGEELW